MVYMYIYTYIYVTIYYDSRSMYILYIPSFSLRDRLLGGTDETCNPRGVARILAETKRETPPGCPPKKRKTSYFTSKA